MEVSHGLRRKGAEGFQCELIVVQCVQREQKGIPAKICPDGTRPFQPAFKFPSFA